MQVTGTISSNTQIVSRKRAIRPKYDLWEKNDGSTPKNIL